MRLNSFGKNQKSFSCILASDLHGNVHHYNTLKNIIVKERASFVFFAGDLLPKDGGLWYPGNTVRTIQTQRMFLENFLIGYLQKLGEYAFIYAIFGNDDFRSNYDLIRKIGKNVRFLNNEVTRLPIPNQEFYLAGYPKIALTPFLQKDWEQWDETVGVSHKTCKLEGYDSYEGTHHPISFKNNNDGRATITSELVKLAHESDPKKTLYLIHEPPFNTPLDQIAINNPYEKNGVVHVGSKAIRTFIETQKPFLTMHGHIHETFHESGSFRWDCGKSISVTPSHNYKDKMLSYIMFDLPGLNTITRYTQDAPT
ncbi:MAG: hypothetical protein COU10_01115 [Candidatus Harrisonbacteria bacterium CG10_big_fil_rev_8_21_14_0_10_45_28]|uniref:Calcineurin-like phosphoesterase domain-containing protein n=1 Tax=Candidatus Harrisonbacteria bacterium CG10_big_fil_rev_8_21_14_0_10_45_28 TaxID=1974586 RepID=A0A2H0UNY1_9BACT|nr:MAG: hypothetical protein COU10_01115 [Candidatus Harrisonbacteria bacterium CG10_big_fil_rev_8_21_14_0_10_45_28]